jgi:hypothetical protein
MQSFTLQLLASLRPIVLHSALIARALELLANESSRRHIQRKPEEEEHSPVCAEEIVTLRDSEWSSLTLCVGACIM